MSMTDWHTLETAPAGKRFTGAEGSTYRLYVELEDGRAPRYVATVQPGRGVSPHVGYDGRETIEPTEGPDHYARAFGREPGPEWTVNGRPFADSVRVYLDADDAPEHPGYSDRAHVEFGYAVDVTDAARRTIHEWLTGPAAAELFSERNRAEAMRARRVSELESAERDVDKLRAELAAAVKRARDASRAARAAADALHDVKH